MAVVLAVEAADRQRECPADTDHSASAECQFSGGSGLAEGQTVRVTRLADNLHNLLVGQAIENVLVRHLGKEARGDETYGLQGGGVGYH